MVNRLMYSTFRLVVGHLAGFREVTIVEVLMACLIHPCTPAYLHELFELYKYVFSDYIN